MRMDWVDLLFMHWPIPAAVVRPLIPADLEIDTYTGEGFERQAFIGVVPFLMTRVRGRVCPPIPTTHTFPELNVRTYVLGPDGRPGVWFFSLDAASALAVKAARATYRLPYRHAAMSIRREGEWVVTSPGARTDATPARSSRPAMRRQARCTGPPPARWNTFSRSGTACTRRGAVGGRSAPRFITRRGRCDRRGPKWSATR